MTDRIRILGIDPGSRFTGFGVVDFAGDAASYVASGTIRSPNGTFPERLRKIFESVGEIVTEYQPAVVSIESVFMARNAGSALKLGQARSAAMCATFSADVDAFGCCGDTSKPNVRHVSDAANQSTMRVEGSKMA